MKKILYIITKSNWGGAQKHVFDLASEFKERGYTTSIAAGGIGKLAEKASEHHIEYKEIKNFGRNMHLLRDFFALIEVYKHIKKSAPDILHLHSPKSGGLGAFAGRMYSFLHSKKEERKLTIIYTVHGFSFNEARSSLQKIAIKFFTWLTLVLCDKVITLSEREKHLALPWPFMQKRLTVIPNGISAISFEEKEVARKIILEKAGVETLTESHVCFGTIAELHKNKNLSFAIDTLKDFPHVYYFILGEGEERDALQKQIKEAGLEKRVFLLGHQSNAGALLKAFDFFLLPSKKEGLPYVLLEAGQAGVPIISTNVGGIPELISSPSDGILIHSNNKKELQTAIEFALANPKKIHKSAEHLKKKVLSTYSIKEMVGKVGLLY